MPTRSKLPAYFKEYLDERFNHVIVMIKGIKTDLVEIKKEVKKIKPQVSENKKNGRIAIILALIALGIGIGLGKEALFAIIASL